MSNGNGNKKIKCLIVNKSNTSKTGGIAHVIFNLYRAIDKSFIDFDLLATKAVVDEEYRKEIENNGGNLFVMTPNFKNIVTYISNLKKLISANKYDVVHIHGNSHTVVLELLAAKLAGCKVRIVHAHSTKCKDLKMHKAMTGIFHRLCTHRIACGEDAGKFMFGNNPFVIINNGINLDGFRYIPEDRDILKEKYGLSGKNVIGHIGSFNDIKNQDLLLDALLEILKKNQNFALVLVGDGERRELIWQKAREMGIEDSVIFAGYTDKISEHLSLFDVFVLPSFFEGLPLVLVEAQASGLHCIASDRVTVEADKTGNMRFLSLEAGAKVWAEEILNSPVVQNRAEISEMNIKVLINEGYSSKDEAQKLLEFYKDAVKGN